MLPVAHESETAVETLTSSVERTTRLELEATLWRCDRCDSFIAIHSRHAVALPVCPTCNASTLEFCGPMPSILRLLVADA